MKKLSLVILLIFTMMLLTSCYFLVSDDSKSVVDDTTVVEVKPETIDEDKDKNKVETVVNLTLKTSIAGEMQEDMVIELYPDIAPNTVNNFIELAQSGFYNGLIFHRVISGFMIQGGDPTGTGMGGTDYTIRGEFSKNGFENNLSHTRGVISMARSQNYDSAGSQFFICHDDASFLDGDYAAFGKLVSGEKTLDNIAKIETGNNDKPKSECKIEEVIVDLNGYNPREVEKIKK